LLRSNLEVETEGYCEMVGIRAESERDVIDFYCREDEGYEFKIQEMGVIAGDGVFVEYEPSMFQLEFMATILSYFLTKAMRLKQQHIQEIEEGKRAEGDLYWSRDCDDQAGELEKVKL